MEEKRNERNKKTRTLKMQIDEKMQQEGSKIDEQNPAKAVPGGRKSMEKWWKDGGPAEGAMAAYFASRKQIRLRLLHFGFVLSTLP